MNKDPLRAISTAFSFVLFPPDVPVYANMNKIHFTPAHNLMFNGVFKRFMPYELYE